MEAPPGQPVEPRRNIRLDHRGRSFTFHVVSSGSDVRGTAKTVGWFNPSPSGRADSDAAASEPGRAMARERHILHPRDPPRSAFADSALP